MKHASLAGVLVAGLLAPAAQALIIEYDYSYDTGFFAPGTQARTVFEAAGDFFASRLGDQLTAIDSSGINNFQITFQNPATGAGVQLNNVDIAANTVRIFAGARELGGSVLGQAGPGSLNVSGDFGFVTNAYVRGQGPDFNAVTGLSAYDFSLWGGAVVFDISTNWSFGLDTGPAPGTFDFLSVALHELAHVFGFGTSDSWDNDVAIGGYTGIASIASHGGNVPLSGDGAHWANGTQSVVAAGPESYIGAAAGQLQETALDPSINSGRRKLITELDLAALDDLGWDIVDPEPPPEPPPIEPQQVPAAPIWLLMLGGLVIAGCGSRVLRQR